MSENVGTRKRGECDERIVTGIKPRNLTTRQDFFFIDLVVVL